MSFEVRTISVFEKEFKKLSKKYPSLKSDLFRLVKQLEDNPFIGTSLGKDFYKVRVSILSKGKGKSGGARIIICVKIIQKRVYLAAIYDKSEKSTITDSELKLLANQIG
jgi:hypothetical protein